MLEWISQNTIESLGNLYLAHGRLGACKQYVGR